MSSITTYYQEVPRCRRCRVYLHPILDKQKSTHRYWTNCHLCRARNTQTRRRRREASRVELQTRSSGGLRQPVSVAAAAAEYGYLRGNGNAGAANASTVHQNNNSHVSNDDEIVMSILSDLCRTNSGVNEERGDGHRTERRDPECSVCSDTFTTDQFPRLQDSSHEPRVCPECFANWLTSRVGNTSWDRIVCPSDGCGVLVSHEAMKTLATAETYARYDELSTRSVLSAIPDFRHCLRPGCNSGQIHDSGVEGNIFRCVACDFLVCTTHEEAFHAGETCKEYDRKKSCQRKAEDDASAERIEGTTKQCPNESCGVRIEKNDGCDHMTCRRCNHEFCWMCFAPYRGPQGIWVIGNHAHRHECMYWRELRSDDDTADGLPDTVDLFNDEGGMLFMEEV